VLVVCVVPDPGGFTTEITCSGNQQQAKDHTSGTGDSNGQLGPTTADTKGSRKSRRLSACNSIQTCWCNGRDICGLHSRGTEDLVRAKQARLVFEASGGDVHGFELKAVTVLCRITRPQTMSRLGCACVGALTAEGEPEGADSLRTDPSELLD